MNNIDFACVILDIMKRHFESDPYLSRDEFYILTGIETRPEKLATTAPEPENTDD